jgi:hypothetical protein
MGEGMKSISYLVSQFPEFSKPHLLVHVAASSISNRFLSKCDPLFGDCTCDKLKQHSPNCGLRRDSAESRDQLKLLARCNKHNVHHRVQKVPAAKVELHDDKEFEQI